MLPVDVTQSTTVSVPTTVEFTALEARVVAVSSTDPVPGPEGPAGADGADGATGPQGPPGPDVTAQVADHENRIDLLEAQSVNETPGEIWVHHMPGATFQDRLLAAIAQAKVGQRRWVRCWQEGGVSDVVTASIPEYPGMLITGPVDDIGMQNWEQNNQSVPFVFRFANAGAQQSLFVDANATIYGISVKDLCFVATNSTSQWWDHPYETGHSAFSITLSNIACHGAKHWVGRPGEAFSGTLLNLKGNFNILPQRGAAGGGQLFLRGSDMFITPTKMNMGWRDSPAGTYCIEITGVGKSHFSNIYLTVYQGQGRGIRVESYGSAQGSVFMDHCVIEGQNWNEPAAGALIRCTNYADFTLRDTSFNFAMANPATTSPASTAMVEVLSNSMFTGDNLRINRANGVADSVPVIHGDGAGVVVNATKIFGWRGNSLTWSQKPRVRITNGAVATVTDASIQLQTT